MQKRRIRRPQRSSGVTLLQEICMITIASIGKLKDRPLQTLQDEYCKRLRAFTTAEVREFKDEPNVHSDREKENLMVMEKEGRRVLEYLKPGDFVVLLDLHGKEWSSEQFAANLDAWQQKSSHIVFVIAGSLGPSPELVARADVRWKLSDLTFTHLMTRVLVLEQIYRAFMITNGRTYHK